MKREPHMTIDPSTWWVLRMREVEPQLEAERARRLRRMTRRESLATFNSLCSVFRPFTPKKQRELDQIRLERMLLLRKRLRRASEAWQHERSR